MRTIHQKLHLQHHRHTGKLLPHQHTSYRGLAVLFGVATLAIGGLNVLARVTADPLVSVYGMVEAQVPAAPAVIAVPTNSTTVSTAQTLVAGSCPIVSPQVAIVINVDGNQAGSGICDNQNDFTVPVTLSPGAHALVANTYTITDEQGPASDPVHIMYTPTAVTKAHTPADSNPAVISATESFSYLGADKTAVWSGNIGGGTAPYHVHIDMGDGSSSDHTIQSGSQQFTHHYSKLQSYNMTIAVADATGTTVSQQFAVTAYTFAQSALAAAGNSTAASGGIAGFGTSTVFGLYGLFVTVFAVFSIIWLEAQHARRTKAAEA